MKEYTRKLTYQKYFHIFSVFRWEYSLKIRVFLIANLFKIKVLIVVVLMIIKQAGGPNVQIPTGRRDGRVSLATNVRPNIVDTSFSMDQMINIFSIKGLSLDDLVILSGKYTFLISRFAL